MRGAALATLVLLTAPATADAQSPAPAPNPVQAGGHIKLEPQGARRDGSRRVALTGERWRVRGTVKPYIPGQKVIVRFYRGPRKVRVVEVTPRRVEGENAARFLVDFASARPGTVTVRATHRETELQATLVANPKRVEVVSPRAGPGARGFVVRLLQRELAALRYAVPRSGVYDDGTGRAVLAFRKMVGMPRTTTADEEVFRRLARGQGAFRVRFPRHGRHVEADLSRQVLALIEPGGRVYRIYHTASGAAATPTIVGSFRFYLKSFGTNAKGMVHSSYFIRGYAVHGFASVPPYPASHGCLRVPIPNAAAIYAWIRLGDRIDVYR